MAHTVTDVALQTQWMSEHKRPGYCIRDSWTEFAYPLASHSVINGAGVAFVTGSVWLGVLEIIIHSVSDLLKSIDAISENKDVLIHIMSKVVYVILFYLLK